MTNLTITIPDDIYARANAIAEATSQPIEQVLLQHLQTLPSPLPQLPEDVQAELDALQHLSDDALWTIAREQISDTVQTRAHELMTRNSRGTISGEEYKELVDADYVEGTPHQRVLVGATCNRKPLNLFQKLRYFSQPLLRHYPT